MDLSFFTAKKETPVSLRRKAEALLARSEDLSRFSRGSAATGENRLKRAGFEGDFRQFRDYRVEDRPQDIDWRRSARSDSTLVKEREKNRQRIIDLHIPNDSGMHFRSSDAWPTKYESAGIVGMAFALWASTRRDPFYLGGEKIHTDDLPAMILEKKSMPSPQWKKNAITILLGDYTEPVQTLETRFSNISGQVLLLQLLDPAELDLPYRGRHIFENNAVKTIVNDTDAIRGDYQSALAAHLDALKNYCRKRNWHYDLARSDSDLAPCLTRALGAIGNDL